MARSNTTTDHDTIRKWAEERGGKPAEVATTAKGDDVGIIRIDFPGFSGEGKLQEVSWDDWFKKFDEANLAFVYEEETADGQRSNFNKLVGRETAAAREKGEKTNRRSIRSGARRSTAGPRGSRQAARPEAARTARSKRSTRGGSTASRGSAQAKKATASRKRTPTSRRAGASAPSSRKGGRARGARKGK
jgi:hypothetical protein